MEGVERGRGRESLLARGSGTLTAGWSLLALARQLAGYPCPASRPPFKPVSSAVKGAGSETNHERPSRSRAAVRQWQNSRLVATR